MYIRDKSESLKKPISRRPSLIAVDRESLALESAGQGLWDWDLDKNAIYFSPTWKSLIGYREEEILNIPESWLGRLHPEDSYKVNDAIEAHRKDITEIFQCEYRLRHRDGSYLWMSGKGRIYSSSEMGKRFIGLQSDITSQKRFQEQFRHDALHDHLTGFPNRILFGERLNQASIRARRDKDFNFAVLFLDLDKLKKINDTFGHAAGDELITHFAKQLKMTCRDIDTVARLGGDEFTVIQPEIKTLQDVETFAQRIIKNTSRSFFFGYDVIAPSVSIGISTNFEGNNDTKELLRDADLALYHSKAKQGPSYTFFKESMKSTFHSHFHLGISLRTALKNKELVLFYQPIFNLATNKLVGMEALMRWIHPHFGIISPLDFIPLAEETEIINELGYWALQQSCKDLHQWMNRYKEAKTLKMHVNVSGRQLDQSTFVNEVIQVLNQWSIPYEFLQLELTESVLAKNPNVSKIQLHKLKDRGVGLALDDFGTGYSSLSLLHQYPFNCIKIDRGFISQINNNPKTQKTVLSINRLAREIDCSTVAEGIETLQEQAKLKELGCDYGQGFILSKALPASEFEKFLA